MGKKCDSLRCCPLLTSNASTAHTTHAYCLIVAHRCLNILCIYETDRDDDGRRWWECQDTSDALHASINVMIYSLGRLHSVKCTGKCVWQAIWSVYMMLLAAGCWRVWPAERKTKKQKQHRRTYPLFAVVGNDFRKLLLIMLITLSSSRHRCQTHASETLTYGGNPLPYINKGDIGSLNEQNTRTYIGYEQKSALWIAAGTCYKYVNRLQFRRDFQSAIVASAMHTHNMGDQEKIVHNKFMIICIMKYGSHRAALSLRL